MSMAFAPDKELPHLELYAPPSRRRSRSLRHLSALLCLAAVSGVYFYTAFRGLSQERSTETLPLDAQTVLDQCRSLQLKPGPPADFHARTQSDRFQPGTGPVLIRNATIWTGRAGGTQVLEGDVLLDKGLIQSVSDVSPWLLVKYTNITTIEANGYAAASSIRGQ
ncbi:hypothetical protein TRAPUB_2821 [Trametes pubescens]|uniref:Uncharacterized protein n=1 Tax=Trametes pubescens TaxID=154538 RepID=A0A1M2VFH6_TRAPU|nr:hypothetical protein TRAPUB_2821 [Trametes pubescens]